MPLDGSNIHLKRHDVSTRYWRYASHVPWQVVGAGSSDSTARLLVLPPLIHNLVRKGQGRAPSPYSAIVARLSRGYGRVEHITPFGQFAEEGSVVVSNRGSEHLDLDRSRMMLDHLRLKTLAGMSEGVTQMNAALGELRGTVTSLGSYYGLASRSVRRMFKDFPKKTQRRLENTPPYSWKDVPSDYLGYLYGVRPIADDIANGCDQLSGMAKEAMRYGFDVRSGDVEDVPYWEPLRTASGQIQFETRGSRRNFCRVGYRFDFPRSWIERVPILTPFSTAWELTRLSFVADWVAPFGNYVASLEAMGQFGPYFSEGFEVYGSVEECNPSAYRLARTMAPGALVVLAPGYTARRMTMQRRALGESSGWNLMSEVRFPDFRNKLGLNHAAQAASLFSQTMYNPPRSWYRT